MSTYNLIRNRRFLIDYFLSVLLAHIILNNHMILTQFTLKYRTVLIFNIFFVGRVESRLFSLIYSDIDILGKYEHMWL